MTIPIQIVLRRRITGSVLKLTWELKANEKLTVDESTLRLAVMRKILRRLRAEYRDWGLISFDFNCEGEVAQ